jgi:hypothetical protein
LDAGAVNPDFQALRAQHFDPLCQRLGLTINGSAVDEGSALVTAEGGTVRIYFECERGLCFFCIGAICDSKSLCSVEEIARRFPRLRTLGEGLQRLSLDEQCSLLESRWNDLQVMFSAEHVPETRKWHQAMMGAYTRRFSKKS